MPSTATPVLTSVRAHQLLPRDVIVQEGFIPITVTGIYAKPCEMLSVHYDSIVASGWRAYHLATPLTVERPEPAEQH